jgi:hypothetical protein
MTRSFEAEFPDDMWAAAGVGGDAAARRGNLARAAQDFDLLERLNAAPRNPDLVAAFLDEASLEGRVLVYGAGTHTRMLLPMLARRPRTRVLAIVDRMAREMRRFEGLDVITPEEAAASDFDWILLSHGTYEDEMMERLISLGVPPERIAPIYMHPQFLRRAADKVAGDLRRKFAGRRIETLLVTCSPLKVVSDETLALAFPPETTLNAYFGRPDELSAVGPFETCDLDESLLGLAWIIENLKPKTVYVRCVIYKNYLAGLLKHRYPHLRVIHELYDHATVWRDHDLERLFGLTPRTMARLRRSEYVSAQTCDLIVSKRSGPRWEQMMAECAAPYRSYFPMIQSPSAPPPPGEPSGIVYAGFLPAPAFLAQFKNGYNFVELLEQTCLRLGVSAELFNSSHGGPYAESIYAPYIERHVGAPIRYCRRLPYDALLNHMQRFAFGWLCDIVSEFQADRYIGVCNRWTGYLSAGLPVVMDAEWTLMAGLTRDFNAGVVVDAVDPATVAAALAAADQESLRRGAGRLRAHLAAHNEAVLSDIVKASQGGFS